MVTLRLTRREADLVHAALTFYKRACARHRELDELRTTISNRLDTECTSTRP